MARRLEDLDREFQSKRLEDSDREVRPKRPETSDRGTQALRLEELERKFQSRLQEARTQPSKGKQETEKRARQRREWNIFLVQTGCVMLAVYLLLTYVIGVTVIHGDSMQPALYEQDIAVLWRLSGRYETGDIVLFQSEAAPETLVKRVIAGPGDTVEIDNETGRVIVNNVILNEPYIYVGTYSNGGNTGPITLGEAEYYVLGDNRRSALDSRSDEVGTVMKGEVLGKIVFLFRASGA